MSFPLFRNGKLLFCKDRSGAYGLATSCCSWNINISVPGWNAVYRYSPDIRIFKATQLFDFADNLLNNDDDSWTHAVTRPTTWRVGLKLKAWQKEYDASLSPSSISWQVQAIIVGTSLSASLSGNMGGVNTDDQSDIGNHDTSGGLSVYVTFDPSAENPLVVSLHSSPRSAMLRSLDQEMENS